MNAPNDNTLPPRVGMRGLIPSWAYRHLLACGVIQIALGSVGAAGGVVCLSYGAYGWAAFFLVDGALPLAFGRWYVSIARSAPSRT
jgi:hypothetical protein